MRAKSVFSGILAAWLLCHGVGGHAQTARAETLSASDIKPALEQLLKEHPEVLLDFLREHCETVLDIAQMGSDHKRMSNLEKQWAQDARVPKKVRTQNRPRVGKSSAKVQIIAFSDFTCNYCQRAEKTVEALIREFSGKVSFVFKNMPLDPEGISGLASQYYGDIYMQSEDLACKFYLILFDQRDELLLKVEDFMRKTATDIGVDMRKMDSQRRQKVVAQVLKEDLEDAEKLNIEGTPYFLVNNLVIRGAIPIHMFRRAIEIELAR